MDNLVKNHFVHAPIRVYEPRSTKKIYNSFSIAPKDGPRPSAPLFSRGTVNKDLNVGCSKK